MGKVMMIMVAFMAATIGIAHAGVFGTVKGWIFGQMGDALISVAALGVSGFLAYLHKVNAARFGQVTRTLAETGHFLTALGDAAKDQSVSREEIGNIIKEGADVVNVFAPTPAKYQGVAPEKH